VRLPFFHPNTDDAAIQMELRRSDEGQERAARNLAESFLCLVGAPGVGGKTAFAAETPSTRRRKWVTRRRKWVARRREWVTRRRKWVTRRREWVTRRREWVARRRKWVARRRKWVTRRGSLPGPGAVSSVPGLRAEYFTSSCTAA
jgi:hypothetical protein